MEVRRHSDHEPVKVICAFLCKSQIPSFDGVDTQPSDPHRDQSMQSGPGGRSQVGCLCRHRPTQKLGSDQRSQTNRNSRLEKKNTDQFKAGHYTQQKPSTHEATHDNAFSIEHSKCPTKRTTHKHTCSTCCAWKYAINTGASYCSRSDLIC